MLTKIIILFISLFFIFSLNFSSATTLPLPSHLIALSSLEGTKLFNRSYSAEYFWPLSLQFVTQKNTAYCSIASSIMVLNALDITAPVDSAYAPYKIFTQDNFFTPEVEKVLPSAMVNKQGATLDQISKALATFPLSIRTFHANELTINQFRLLAKKAINKKQGYIIVNFLRSALGEEGYGHLSPLAAYDKTSDRFLMLDVARYRYPSTWVKTEDLWKAMNTIDKDANSYRGLMILSKSSFL